MPVSVAVVLPAFNEALGLKRLVWRIARALNELDYEIVIVDDGSTDDTAVIAAFLAEQVPLRLIRHTRNSGYGAAIRTGVLEARRTAEAVVTMDADDSHDPALIPLMLHGLACGSDVIVASRFVPGGREIGVPFHRRVLSHGAAFVFGRLLRVPGLHDYTSGYRAYSRRMLDRMVAQFGEADFSREEGFTVGVELLLKAHAAGARIAEIPLVLRYDRKESESKLRLGRTLVDYWRLLQRVRDGAREKPKRATVRRAGTDAARVAISVAADAVAVIVGFGVGFLLATGFGSIPALFGGGALPSSTFVYQAAIYAVTVGVCFWAAGLYATRSSVSLLSHLQRVLEGLGLATTLYFTVLFLGGVTATPLAVTLVPVGLAFSLVMVERRGLVAYRNARHRRRPARGRRILVYGADTAGRQLAKQILTAPLMEGHLVGFLDDSLAPGASVPLHHDRQDASAIEPRVLGGRADLARVVAETHADQLYIGTTADAAIADELVAMAKVAGLDVGVVPRLGVSGPDLVELDEVGTIPVFRAPARDDGMPVRALKRAIDIGVVILVLPVAIPIAVVTAVAVAIDGRPVLFRQTRIGRLGRPFTVFKFRTMRSDCDPYAESPETDADPRVTRVGRLVRLAGIDELPQLVNVLRGEMSLVGPRPEMPQIAAGYGERERQRLAVRPGMTGIWQLSPDRSGPIHESLEHDFYYLRRQSLSFDVLVLFETALFAARCVKRSLAASARELLERRKGSPATGLIATPPNLGYVLVALDQRRRPDEPATWSEYIPRAASLASERAVKLVVAEMNEARIAELSARIHGAAIGADLDEPLRAGQLEYVAYETSEFLHRLASEATVVFTDLGFVADRAASVGVPVVQVTDEGLHYTGYENRPERRGAAEQVLAAFLGPNDELRYA